MGAYNEVKASVLCPNCLNVSEVDIQFKYGNTNGLRYAMGQRITWSGNEVGSSQAGEVLVEGEAVLCPICGYEGEWPVLLKIRDDVLIEASTHSLGTDPVRP